MELKNASPLGKGSWHPAGSVADEALMTSLLTYRRRVAGMYRSVKPGEITTIPMTWAGWPMQSVNIRSPAKLEPGDTKHWEPSSYFRTTFS